MSAEDFGGFGDDAGADDFGFDDDFEVALKEAEMAPEAAAEKVQKASSKIRQLPRTNSFAHSDDGVPDDGAAAAAPAPPKEEDEPSFRERVTSVGGGVAGVRAEATGTKSGWMKMLIAGGKMTLARKPWKERWFALADGKLVIQAGPYNDKQKRTIDLSHALAFQRDEGKGSDPARFSLVTKAKDFFFTARNAAECQAWIENLELAKEKSGGNFTSAHSSGVSAMMF
mmetsp:Transcript_23543/g.61627  ORF Transcript_23543/g.61627 Transcript_23543/m.61627 type:complete len:227 (+) Transcript_23543:76-756(+)|eukprot:CAMPEP_0182917880 /NCGR_PEP_ID=MMETSP0105_2-20130417/1756_1 /TAXON_ID=81532 ORGANISM="Acanthoeca-like sp., Strain 10tr" /NCGR_SAMPLE_ID=MMETSP0105_2 /ASSEMBLY_ACC=CAM_ASM_000205 /LENGTH=226 /DNA_ID=CAMNT_0025054899 /DNA_START=66 /DNA_END=746 /DNA_ORIENTATION=+